MKITKLRIFLKKNLKINDNQQQNFTFSIKCGIKQQYNLLQYVEIQPYKYYMLDQSYYL